MSFGQSSSIDLVTLLKFSSNDELGVGSEN
jgi:hypothetical protein